MLAQEDQALLAVVRTMPRVKWIAVASQLHEDYGILGKSGKQCRERWLNHVDPGLSKAKWSAQEEHILYFYQQIFGNKWAYIAKYLPGRSENSIKNQFYSSIRKLLRQYNRAHPQAPITGKVKEISDNSMLVELLLAQDSDK